MEWMEWTKWMENEGHRNGIMDQMVGTYYMLLLYYISYEFLARQQIHVPVSPLRTVTTGAVPSPRNVGLNLLITIR